MYFFFLLKKIKNNCQLISTVHDWKRSRAFEFFHFTESYTEKKRRRNAEFQNKRECVCVRERANERDRELNKKKRSVN